LRAQHEQWKALSFVLLSEKGQLDQPISHLVLIK